MGNYKRILILALLIPFAGCSLWRSKAARKIISSKDSLYIDNQLAQKSLLKAEQSRKLDLYQDSQLIVQWVELEPDGVFEISGNKGFTGKAKKLKWFKLSSQSKAGSTSESQQQITLADSTAKSNQLQAVKQQVEQQKAQPLRRYGVFLVVLFGLILLCWLAWKIRRVFLI